MLYSARATIVKAAAGLNPVRSEVGVSQIQIAASSHTHYASLLSSAAASRADCYIATVVASFPSVVLQPFSTYQVSTSSNNKRSRLPLLVNGHPGKERNNIQVNFNEEKVLRPYGLRKRSAPGRLDIIVSTLGLLSTGYNLHRANYLVILEPNHSVEVFIQACGREHRVG
ncbi:hypothetical protein EV356DRAFT_310957 [Viridothelium virens]|uniref:Helicase C-terminal domain-containing protein n=1 Tax=Viridothelium virens TaxID=1048519 RepID=A0A6A6GZC2_VIRVR|nr:hypothetical protein EV356DRAFT_310957 [Viridothelium virens]